jgi:hypothetical protein
VKRGSAQEGTLAYVANIIIGFVISFVVLIVIRMALAAALQVDIGMNPFAFAVVWGVVTLPLMGRLNLRVRTPSERAPARPISEATAPTPAPEPEPPMTTRQAVFGMLWPIGILALLFAFAFYVMAGR